MRRSEIKIKSTDNIHELYVLCWEPDEKPIGIFQISHGMTEFVERYDRFASYLTEKGFVVIGNDHLGHGKSVNSQDEWGYFGKDSTHETVVNDLKQVRDFACKQFPGIPYVLFGHSMGSFLAAEYACKYSDTIDKLILSGTGYTNPATRIMCKLMVKVSTLMHGDQYKSKVLDTCIFGNYNKKEKNPLTPQDWLTRDRDILNRYLDTPACTFKFSNNGFNVLIGVVDYVHRLKNLNKIRKNLPVLFIAGTMDPVGNYGRGVTKISKKYRKAGVKDVTLILIEDDRHEILNEINYKDTYEKIYDWLHIERK